MYVCVCVCVVCVRGGVWGGGGGGPIVIYEEREIAQSLERRTRDRKVTGQSPRRSGRRIFFSRVNFLY